MTNAISHQRVLDFLSESETEAFGLRLAERLQPGDVVALIGPLGAGKTRVTKAVAQGLGVPRELVNSPTFTLIQEYSGSMPIRHCDAYRLKSPSEFRELGLEELFIADGVALIEWADRILDDLPPDRLEIHLEPTSLTARRVTLLAHGPRSIALLGGL